LSNINKYSTILLKGTIGVTLANAGTRIASLLILPIITCYLSPQDYGTVAVVLLIGEAVGPIVNPGMHAATLRLYHATSSEDERKRLIGSAHTFYVIMPLLVLGLSILSGPFLFTYLFKGLNFYPYGFLAVLLMFFQQSRRSLSSLLALQYKVHVMAVCSAIAAIVSLLLTLLFVVVLKLGAMGKVLGLFPGAIILFAISWITVRRYTNGSWSIVLIKRQLLFGLPLLWGILAYQIMSLAGRYLVERMTDLHQLGLYSLGLSVAQLPIFLIEGFKKQWGAVFYENMNLKDYKTVSKLMAYFVGILTMAHLFLILYVKEALIIVVNERYYTVIPIVGFMILGVYFSGLTIISNAMLSYDNKFRVISRNVVIAAILNIALNIILIPVIGIMGTAIASLVSFVFCFLAGLWYQRETLISVQTKGLFFAPVVVLPLISVCTYLLTFFFDASCLNAAEIMIKTGLLVTSAVVFYKAGMFSVNDVSNVCNLAVSLLFRRSEAYE